MSLSQRIVIGISYAIGRRAKCKFPERLFHLPPITSKMAPFFRRGQKKNNFSEHFLRNLARNAIVYVMLATFVEEWHVRKSSVIFSLSFFPSSRLCNARAIMGGAYVISHYLPLFKRAKIETRVVNFPPLAFSAAIFRSKYTAASWTLDLRGSGIRNSRRNGRRKKKRGAGTDNPPRWGAITYSIIFKLFTNEKSTRRKQERYF